MSDKFPFTVKRLNDIEPLKKRSYIYDDKQPGLRMYVTPSGTKTFQFQVRSKELGKIVSRILGKYPALKINEAREQAAGLLSEVNAGVDIESKKRDDLRKRLLDPTVKEFAKEFIEKYSMLKKRTWQEDQRILNKDVIPVIGNLQMTGVKKRDIVSVLDRVQDRGAMIACNRTLAVVSKMFNFALERDVIESFPVYGIKKRGEERSRDRILSDDEIKLLWKSLGNTSVSMLLKFLLITGQRTGEIRQMLFSEIENDVLTIPSKRTKNKLIHIVPLSTMALHIVNEMKKISKSDFVFPGRAKVGGVDKCLDKNAAAHHFRKFLLNFDWNRTTVHDLRRTVRSNLSKLRVRKTVAERILNHKEQGVAGVYDRHDYLEEKKEALQKWSDKLNKIAAGKTMKTAKIIDIKTKGAI
ncbi:MAG: tyrosine-type recombinase/integrase [archaeon]|nr:tyrosine-type recombinase/integrase [archaeon]